MKKLLIAALIVMAVCCSGCSKGNWGNDLLDLVDPTDFMR